MQSAAGGTIQRLKPGPATVRSRSRIESGRMSLVYLATDPGSAGENRDWPPMTVPPFAGRYDAVPLWSDPPLGLAQPGSAPKLAHARASRPHGLSRGAGAAHRGASAPEGADPVAVSSEDGRSAHRQRGRPAGNRGAPPRQTLGRRARGGALARVP